jgi:ribosomal protein S18 acetylase RimI-like enzyme
MKGIEIKLIKQIDSKQFSTINQLIKQLDPELDLITKKRLKKISQQTHVKILVATTKNHPKKIVGIVFLVHFQTLAGNRGRIEDLIVEKNYRQQGIGRNLVKKAISLAKKLKLKSIELTSRPARIAANKLYQSLNFVKKETNVYQLNLNK